MGAITINLSEDAQRMVDRAVSRGDYPDAGAYFEALVAERRARATEELNRLLDEAAAGGDCGQTIEQIFAEAKEGLRSED